MLAVGIEMSNATTFTQFYCYFHKGKFFPHFSLSAVSIILWVHFAYIITKQLYFHIFMTQISHIWFRFFLFNSRSYHQWQQFHNIIFVYSLNHYHKRLLTKFSFHYYTSRQQRIKILLKISIIHPKRNSIYAEIE